MNLEVTGISNALRLRAVGETVACPQASTCETVGIPSTPKPSPNQVLLTSHAPCTPPVLAHPFWRAAGAGEGWSRMQSIAATPAPSPLAPHFPPLQKVSQTEWALAPPPGTRRGPLTWLASGNEHWWHFRSMNYWGGPVKHHRLLPSTVGLGYARRGYHQRAGAAASRQESCRSWQSSREKWSKIK